MSHTVEAKTTLSNINIEIIKDYVLDNGGEWLGLGRHRLFSGEPVTGNAFKLKGWRFPIVITESGKVAYDNYGGNWGNVEDLHKLQQECMGQELVESARMAGFTIASKTRTRDGKQVIRVVR